MDTCDFQAILSRCRQIDEIVYHLKPAWCTTSSDHIVGERAKGASRLFEALSALQLSYTDALSRIALVFTRAGEVNETVYAIWRDIRLHLVAAGSLARSPIETIVYKRFYCLCFDVFLIYCGSFTTAVLLPDVSTLVDAVHGGSSQTTKYMSEKLSQWANVATVKTATLNASPDQEKQEPEVDQPIQSEEDGNVSKHKSKVKVKVKAKPKAKMQAPTEAKANVIAKSNGDSSRNAGPSVNQAALKEVLSKLKPPSIDGQPRSFISLDVAMSSQPNLENLLSTDDLHTSLTNIRTELDQKRPLKSKILDQLEKLLAPFKRCLKLLRAPEEHSPVEVSEAKSQIDKLDNVSQ